MNTKDQKLIASLLFAMCLSNIGVADALTLDECCAQYPDKCTKTFNEESKELQTQCKIPVETTLQDSKNLDELWSDVLSAYKSNEANWDNLYAKLKELNEFFKLKKDVTKLNAIKTAMQTQIDKRQAIITFINNKLAE